MSICTVPGRRRFMVQSATLGILATLPSTRALAASCKSTASSSWVPDDTFLGELPRVMQAFAVPGVGIAVVEGGAVAWSRGFGLADVQTGRAVDARTVFEDASLSKPVFA